MKDQEKTNEQTIRDLRQRVAELEAAEARRQKPGEALSKAKDELELRVEERTAELRAINEGLLREIADCRVAETALRESERKFRLVTETIQDVFWMSTPNIAQIIYVSPGYEKIWRRTTESLYKSPESFLDSIHPDDREQFIRLLRDHHRIGKEYTCEYRIVLPDDSIRWILERGFPIHDDNGILTLMCGVSTDITERKLAGELVRQAEHRYRRLFEDAPFMYVITRNGGGVPFISDCNELFLMSVGYSREEVVGKPLADFYSPESRFDLLAGGGYTRALAGEFLIGERQLLTLDGRLIPTLLYAATEVDPSGQVTGTRAMFVDITDRKRAEEALFQAKHDWEDTFNSINDMITIHDKDFDIISYNKAAEKLLGLPGSFVPNGIKCYEYYHGKCSPPEGCPSCQCLVTGDQAVFELFEPHLNMFMEIRAIPRFDSNSQLTGLIHIVRDITDRKKAEGALRHSEQMLKAILSASPVGIVVTRDRRIRWANDTWIKMFGFTGEQEYLDQPTRIMHHSQESYAHARKILYDGLQPGQVSEADLTLKRKDGTSFDSHVRISLVDASDPSMGTISAIADISDRKKAEEALRESEERYRAVVDNVEIGISLLSSNLEIVAINKAMKRYFPNVRPSCKQICYETYNDPPGSEPCSYCPCILTLQDGEVHEAVTETPSSAGTRYYHLVSSPVRNANGAVQYIIELVKDITEHNRAEEALRESEDRYRDLVENIQDLICTHDLQGNLLFVNQAPATVLGYSPADLVGTNLRSLLAPEVRDQFDAYLAAIQRDGQASGMMLVQTKSGEKRIWEYHNTLRTEGPGEPIVRGLARDITDRKRAEEALEESDKQYRTLFEDSIDGVYSVRRDGEITDSNASFCRLFGYTREEMIGKDIRELYLDPADRPKFQKEIEGKGFVKDYEVKFRKRDGTEVYCMLTSSVHFGKDGSIAGYRGILRDLTVRRALRRQLLQAQKMEAVGTLAGGIAHDFNNLLQVVLGYSELVLADEDLPARLRDDLEKVLLAARNGADLVQRLLTFSRKTETKPLDLDLNQRIRQTQKFLQRTIPKMIIIELALADDLADIHADPTQVDQVLMNLAVNARDSMPEGGNLVIETANVVIDEDYARSNLEAKPGRYVLLRVSDNGSGMDKETLEHIFEPFYTTKGLGQGTGLGLAVVFGIVKQHQGFINCYSQVGHGTTFKVYFPAIIIPAARSDQPVVTSMPQGGTETILLVDDEQFVRDLGKRILERSGYKVLTADNGKQALDIYRKEISKISLVILDLIMPEMGGKECLPKLLEINPHVKVLVASGYTSGGTLKGASEIGARGFVRKPYDIRRMLRDVRDVLDSD